MNDAKNSKRLDKIELQLTPKQWAIRLADEMRRCVSQDDFLKAIGKGTYRQSPFTKPFYTLAQQAQEHWPESSPENIRRREKLDRELRAEFQARKTLIINVNTTIKVKAETNRLKAALQLSKLHGLNLQDAIAHAGVAETLSTSPGSPTRRRLISLLEDWADDSANLLMETIPYKIAVQTIQKDFFESHPILYKDNEIALEIAIRTVRDSIAAFNEYLKVRSELSNRESAHRQPKADVANVMPFDRESSLPVDIEAVEKRAEMLVNFIVQQWVKNAKFRGNADILHETGQHEDFVWEHFRKDVGLES